MRSTTVFRTAVVCVAMMSVGVCGFAQTTNPPTSDAVDKTLVVPAGTVIPLTLVDGIKAKSTPVGGTVRATVAFPVTVGTRLAIPAGVFVEGQLVQSQFPKGYKQPKGALPVSPLRVHFTKLIYPNGYTVMMDSQVSAELLTMPMPGVSKGVEVAELEVPEIGRGGGPSDADPWMGMAGEPLGQTPVYPPLPPLPPLPASHVGPNPVEIVVPVLAVTAGLVTGAILLSRHQSNKSDSLLFGAGYPFQMSLSAPLMLDPAQIGKDATVGDPGGQ